MDVAQGQINHGRVSLRQLKLEVSADDGLMKTDEGLRGRNVLIYLTLCYVHCSISSPCAILLPFRPFLYPPLLSPFPWPYCSFPPISATPYLPPLTLSSPLTPQSAHHCIPTLPYACLAAPSSSLSVIYCQQSPCSSLIRICTLDHIQWYMARVTWTSALLAHSAYSGLRPGQQSYNSMHLLIGAESRL